MPKSAERAALEALDEALEAVVRAASTNPQSRVISRIRKGLSAHAEALEAARARADSIKMPSSTFDPADPKIVGRMVSLALLAQPRNHLADTESTYGSGVYAIYYEGEHPFYADISGTETPIYVGKADPANGDASTSREQGARLTARLLEHAGTIKTTEQHAASKSLSAGLYPIRLKEFTCRKLVCATNAQLVAEKHLIRMFWPVWNADTKACWGMSKHGDAAKTRANKRSPWDVVHPGRVWAMDELLVDSLSPTEISERIKATLSKAPPRKNHAALLDEVLLAFRQDTGEASGVVPVPPVGKEASGPEDDEAGGKDDESD